jgi:hypothetical protein
MVSGIVEEELELRNRRSGFFGCRLGVAGSPLHKDTSPGQFSGSPVSTKKASGILSASLSLAHWRTPLFRLLVKLAVKSAQEFDPSPFQAIG